MAISGGSVYAGGQGGSGGGLDPRIPENWATIVQEQMFAKRVAMAHFTDLSSEFKNGGDIVNLSDFYTNVFTATQQNTAGTEVTLSNPALVNVTLTINTDDYIAFFRSNSQMAQLLDSAQLQSRFLSKASQTLLNTVEAAIFALWSGLSGNTAVGATTAAMTELQVRQVIETLDALDFDIYGGDVAWFFHQYVYWDQLVGFQKYYDATIYGAKSAPATGLIGSGNPGTGNRGVLYGIPVFVSTNVKKTLLTYRNLLAHRDAFGYAFQQVTGNGNPVAVNLSYENRNLGWLTTLEVLFGTAELRDKAAVLFNVSSADTVS